MGRQIYMRIYAPGFDMELVPTEIYSFVYSEAIHGCARWSLVIRTDRYDKFDSFVKWNEDQPFELEFGYKEPQLQVTRKRVLLLESSRRTLGSAAYFTFRGLCAGHLLNLKVLTNKVWEDSISNIVKEIISDCGLEAKVEQTEGKYKIACGWDRAGPFICKYLMPLAYSSKGNDWALTIEDGRKAIFAPVEIGGARWKFTDFREAHKESQWITLFLPELRKSTLLRPWRGDGLVEVRSYSPGSAVLSKFKANESNVGFRYLQGGKPRPANKSELVKPSFFHEGVNTKVSDQTQVMHEAKTRWSLDARGLYRLNGLVKFDPTVRVGDICRVVISHNKFGTHVSSTGLYLLNRMESYFTRGEIKTFVSLTRRWEI